MALLTVGRNLACTPLQSHRLERAAASLPSDRHIVVVTSHVSGFVEIGITGRTSPVGFSLATFPPRQIEDAICWLEERASPFRLGS